MKFNMENKIHISLVQAGLIWENTFENLNKFDRLLATLPAETEIVILPEMFSTGFTMQVQNLDKPVGKIAFEWLKNKSKTIEKIIVGSILTEVNGKYFNRMYWMRPDGSYDYYDKRHLFHQGGEDKVMTAGNKRTIVNYKNHRFLLQICYDLRFPVWSKNNFDKETGKYDYDVIVYIANWPETRKSAYLSLLKARAVENQAFVIWVNRTGRDNNKIFHSGDTQVVDYKGSIVSMISNEESILSTVLDFSGLQTFRNNFTVGLDWDEFKIYL
jgi:predicted amidohydrolase